MFGILTKEDRIKSRNIPDGMTVYREEIGGVVYASPDQLHGVAWRGSALKHEWYYRFQSPAHLKVRSDIFFESVQANKKRADERKAQKVAFQTSMKPGTILSSSWGYEQTNINWYEVIEVIGKCTVVIREITGTLKETGFMCGDTWPCPGAWARDSLPMRKRAGSLGGIGREYININSCQTAFIWDGKKEYCSWYG